MQPIQWSHVDILARTHSKYAIRGGSGLIYLLTFLIVSLTIAGCVTDPLKSEIKKAKAANAKLNLDNSIFPDGKLDDSRIIKGLADLVRPYIAWWMGIDEPDDFLFFIPSGPEKELNDGRISDSLRQAFEEKGQPLPENVSVSVVEADRKWRIDDENKLYAVRSATGAIAVREVDPLVEYLVVQQPPLLSLYLLVLMVFIPFMSCLVSFNLLAGDIGTQGLRYLLLRTERINIIVARLLGAILFSAVISLFVMLIVVTYIAVQFDSDSFFSLLKWGLVGWIAMLALSLPYICLGTWLSAALDSPIATLVLCILATAFPIIFLKVAKIGMVGSDTAWLDRLTPWGWMYDLLHPHWQQSILALLVMLGFAVLLGLLAMRHFLKRDL